MSFGAIGTAVAGSVASAGASSLLSSMFGSGDDVDNAYGPQLEQMNKMSEAAGKRADATFGWAQQGWGALDEYTQSVLDRIDPIASQQLAVADSMQGIPDKMAGVGDALTDYGETLAGYGKEAIDRHRGVYQPLEDEAIQDYRDYASGERGDMRAARAAADSTAAFDAARENALRQLEGYGVGVSARHDAMDLPIRLAAAANSSKLQTDARAQVEQEARDMRLGLMEFGKNYPAWGQEYSRLGMAGQEAGGKMQGSAVDAGQGVSGVYGDAAKSALSGGELANRTYNTGVGMYGAAAPYGNTGVSAGQGGLSGTTAQTNASNVQQGRYDPLAQQVGAAVGEGVGTYINTRGGSSGGYSGRPVGSLNPGRTTGQTYAQGGEIEGPGGPYDDQVAINASDGEYMIPYEVVHRKGTEFFDRLVDKTRGELQAIPV